MARRKSISQSAWLLLLLGLLTGALVLGISKSKLKRAYNFSNSGSVSNVSFGTKHVAGTETTRAEEGAADQTMIRLGLYTPYLEKLCPRPTLDEEERIVAESGRDPHVMLGLVFAYSPRAERWLREAFRAAPEDPLVHYGILSRNDPGYDRLQSALALAKAAPEDAAPLHAAALESLIRGDRSSAIAYLKEAAQLEQLSSFYQSALGAAIDVYQRAGRPEDEARVRIFLESTGRWESVTQLMLEQRLGVRVNSEVQLQGNEEVAPLLLV